MTDGMVAAERSGEAATPAFVQEAHAVEERGVMSAGPRPCLVFLLLALAVVSAGCTGTPSEATSEPPEVTPSGFSRAGLAEIEGILQEAVDRGEVGGAVTLVYRRGEIARVDAVGHRDLADTRPMTRDTLFRIASMSKPIAAVATLILVDEGRLRLDDPVDRWLPELADRRVLRHPSDPLDTAVPAARPIRVEDLLTHRSGIVTPRDPEGPLRAALTRADANNAVGYDRWLEWIGELPLAHEPGSTYSYGNSFDVLGILVERVSGQRYPEFLRERIFEPLGMDDTAFRVPPGKRDRFAPLQDLGTVPRSWIPSPESVPGFPAAAGGLYSTVDDYLRFARMLLGGGRLGDMRILEQATVEDMTTDRLTKEQREGDPFGTGPGYWDGQGFGLGVAVKLDAETHASQTGIARPGAFAWPGIFGTWWCADPAEDLIVILMVPGGEEKANRLRWAFQQAVYDAIVE